MSWVLTIESLEQHDAKFTRPLLNWSDLNQSLYNKQRIHYDLNNNQCNICFQEYLVMTTLIFKFICQPLPCFLIHWLQSSRTCCTVPAMGCLWVSQARNQIWCTIADSWSYLDEYIPPVYASSWWIRWFPFSSSKYAIKVCTHVMHAPL